MEESMAGICQKEKMMKQQCEGKTKERSKKGRETKDGRKRGRMNNNRIEQMNNMVK